MDIQAIKETLLRLKDPILALLEAAAKETETTIDDTIVDFIRVLLATDAGALFVAEVTTKPHAEVDLSADRMAELGLDGDSGDYVAAAVSGQIASLFAV